MKAGLGGQLLGLEIGGLIVGQLTPFPIADEYIKE